ncbi:MAG TPA: RHS repeat-associated core domain-containing protein [Luteimonas sp.]|nr:RHS repeat-associated core domain-containing protein [Luteimonas sp.]
MGHKDERTSAQAVWADKTPRHTLRPGWACGAAALALAYAASAPVFAYDTPETQYKTSLTKAQTIDPLGNFGEQVSLRAGTLSFRNVDIELPGTGPTIRIVRTAQLEDGYGTRTSSGNAISGWEFEIPRIKTITADPLPAIRVVPLSPDSPIGWQVPATDKNARCTHFAPPRDIEYPGSTVEFFKHEWWFGYQLVDDQGNEQPLMGRSSELAGQQYKIGTGDNWVVGCLPTTANGEPGEAFQAIAPDGTKYWFNYLTYSGYANLIQVFENQPPKGYDLNYTLPRKSASMLVTRIEDRFGNWVNYSYSGSKLAAITASDGRSVTFSWQSNSVAVTVGTAPNTRTWTYGPANGYGMQVTQPDGSYWGYSGEFWLPLSAPYEFAGCSQVTLFPLSGSRQVSVRAPSGATASFHLDRRFFGRSYAPKYCGKTPTIYDGDPGFSLVPKLWIGYSLTTKTVSGAGLPTQSWNYAYSPHNGSWQNDCPTPTSCTSTVWTQVTEPGGDRTVSHFSNRWDQTENKLVKEETFAAGGTLLRTVDYAYATTPSNAPNPYPWPLSIATFADPLGNNQVNLRWTPLKRRTTTQDGVSFVWEANSYDSWARSTDVSRSSSLGYGRRDATAYADDLTKWVIGQVATVTCISPVDCAGRIESKTEYDANAMPWKIHAFGKLQQTLAYHANGMLASATDANNRATSFSNWKRGIPQTIAFADATSKSAVVDDLGQIASVTDENGFATSYGYDAMGRLTSIAHPTGDTTDWDVVERAFEWVDEEEYGLPAGHWRQSEYIDDYTKVVYYDALWRPVVEQEEDATNDAATLRWRNTRYDHDGRVVFASYPRNPYVDGWADHTGAPMGDPLATPMAGTHSAYDALGRTTQVKQDSELGQLTTTTQYLPGLLTQVTNPRNQSAITGYMAYDQPGYDWPVSVSHPEGAYTDILRDVYGKPKTLTRRNANSSLSVQRHLVYDANQRLCKSIEPETGTTFYQYDDAGNLTRTDFGAPASAVSPCSAPVGTTGYATRTYDARNRLKTLAFPDQNGNQTWTYTPDGLPKKIVTVNSEGDDTAINEYFYNKRRLLTAETLGQPDWYTWRVDYEYNGKGQLAGQEYPNGLYVDYDVNALGQPTRAGDFATGVQYYPNGSIKQFTYGNGIVHTMTQNARQLPARSIDSGVLNYDTRFDANGNVTQIYDLARGTAYDRQMQYDGLDRLTAAASTSFGGDGWHRFTYNVLDNLTSWKLAGVKDYASYYYEPGTNRLTNILNTGGASVAGMSYDAQGNLANKNGVVHDFDFGNRLREVVGKEGYHYDGHGRRILTWRPDDSLDFSLYGQSGQLWYQEYDAKGLAVENVYLAGSLIATYEYNWNTDVFVTKYHHTDALGSPVAVTNAAGQVTDRTDWEPYGAAIGKPAYEGIGFTGHVHDAATKLTYMQQRYYDPGIGRFLSVDPVTANANSGVNFNRYAYANNNPYKFLDPDGRYSCSGAMICQAVKNALETMNRSLRNLETSDPEKAAIVRAAIEEIGTKGDGRGPSYIPGEVNGEGIAHTNQRGTTKLDMVELRTAGKNEIAKALGHEATHDIDVRTNGEAKDEAGYVRSETSAYRATQAVAKGLGEIISDEQVANSVEKSVKRVMDRMQQNANQ